MESTKRDGPGDLAFYLDVLAQVETTRRMARVAVALALKMSATDSPPTQARFMRQTLTAGIPELLAGAQSAGIPEHELNSAAIEAYARRVYRDSETRFVLDGPWNHQEDLPQWLVDRKAWSDRDDRDPAG